MGYLADLSGITSLHRGANGGDPNIGIGQIDPDQFADLGGRISPEHGFELVQHFRINRTGVWFGSGRIRPHLG